MLKQSGLYLYSTCRNLLLQGRRSQCCRDRGWTTWMGGGLVPVLVQRRFVRGSYHRRDADGLYPHEGQAQGPHPSTSSTPCPYRIQGRRRPSHSPIRLATFIRLL